MEALMLLDLQLRPLSVSIFTLLAIAIGLITILVVGCFSWNSWLRRREIQCITEEDEGSVYLGEEIH
jgi:hypothetical protein